MRSEGWFEAVCDVVKAAAPDAEARAAPGTLDLYGQQRICSIVGGRSAVVVKLHAADGWDTESLGPGDDLAPLYRGVQEAWARDQA